MEHQFFDKEIDIEAEDGISFLTRLYEQLKYSKLEIHFNQALFSNKIQPFQAFTKETLPSEYQPGMLKLQPEAVLGLFPQSDSVLIPDFEFLEENQVALEDIFLKQIDVNQIITEKNLFCPLPLDGSQEECIRHISEVQNRNPGGKSQRLR